MSTIVTGEKKKKEKCIPLTVYTGNAGFIRSNLPVTPSFT
jgi:hypothetical protein